MAAQAKNDDIEVLINKQQSFCLNVESGHPMANLFMGDHTLYVASDTDEQLIIHIEFREHVKIVGMDIVGPADHGPLTVHLFANTNGSLSFSNVEDMKATQTLNMTQEDLQADSITNLYQVKFQRVSSLTIFIEDNQENEESTHLSKLRLFGCPIAGTNMAEFKKVGWH